MKTIAIDFDLKKLHAILQRESGADYFAKLYPEEMFWYHQNIRFGFDNEFVQAALKAIWQEEMERDVDHFVSILEGSASS